MPKVCYFGALYWQAMYKNKDPISIATHRLSVVHGFNLLFSPSFASRHIAGPDSWSRLLLKHFLISLPNIFWLHAAGYEAALSANFFGIRGNLLASDY